MIRYLAFVLSEESRDRVLALYPPKHSVVIAHHVTLKWNADISDMAAADPYPRVAAIGYTSNDRLDCILATVNFWQLRPDNSYYHVTLSTQPGVESRESNDLLKLTSPRVERGVIMLKGIVRLLEASE